MGKKRLDGYWKNESNVLIEAKKILSEIGEKRLPSLQRLQKLGYGSFVHASVKYHRGLIRIRELLGEEINETLERRKSNLWRNLEYAIEQAKELMKNYSFETLPNGDELKTLGYSDLGNAISRYHGGFGKFRKILGEEPRRYGFWQNKDIIKEIQKIKEEYDFERIPSKKELERIKRHDLVNAIAKRYGGFRKLRQDFREKQKRIEDGEWKNLATVLEKAKSFIEEHGLEELPPKQFLYEKRNSSLAYSIRNNGGFPAFRGKLREYMGQTSTEDQLKNMLEKYLWREDE